MNQVRYECIVSAGLFRLKVNVVTDKPDSIYDLAITKTENYLKWLHGIPKNMIDIEIESCTVESKMSEVI